MQEGVGVVVSRSGHVYAQCICVCVIHVYMYIYIYIYMGVLVHARRCWRSGKSIRTCVCTVYMCVCVCIICVYIYTHTWCVRTHM